MKKAIILVAVILAGLGLWFKFGGRVKEEIKAAKNEPDKGSPNTTLLDKGKNLVGGNTPAGSDEKLPLATAEFIRQLPGSLAAVAEGTKPDVVLEITGAEGGQLPEQIQLAPNVWLNMSSLQLAGAAKPGARVLVHLQNAAPASADVSSPQHVVQGASEPVPKSLDDGIARGRWRSTLGMPDPIAMPGNQTPYLWATAFENRAERGDLHGVASVEGTFGQWTRAGGNSLHHTLTLEECRSVKFFFNKGSSWEATVVEAEKYKKAGNKVTLRMTIDLDTTPKYAAQNIAWGIPLKDKLEFWKQTISAKNNFIGTLAVAAWAEARDLDDEAKALYAKAHAEVTAETVGKFGKSTKGIRVHLQDAVQDHWFYEVRAPVSEAGHYVPWKDKKIAEDFYGVPTAVCFMFHTNPRQESNGDYYVLKP